MNTSENSKMNNSGIEQDILPYPPEDKRYPSAARYSSYDSIQTGAMGKAAK